VGSGREALSKVAPFAAYPRCSTDRKWSAGPESQANVRGDMPISLVVAAVFVLLLGCAHSYLGERYILIRLFRRGELPELLGGQEFTRRTLRFAWHLTTVAWFGLASILLVVAAGSVGRRPELQVIAATFLVSGMVSLVASRGRHVSWVVFLAVAGLVWLAT
jgi:hypothetical protein